MTNICIFQHYSQKICVWHLLFMIILIFYIRSDCIRCAIINTELGKKFAQFFFFFPCRLLSQQHFQEQVNFAKETGKIRACIYTDTGDLRLIYLYILFLKVKVKVIGVSSSWHPMDQSMEFSRPENWTEQLFTSPGDLPNPGIKPKSPTLQADSLRSEPPGKLQLMAIKPWS